VLAALPLACWRHCRSIDLKAALPLAALPLTCTNMIKASYI